MRVGRIGLAAISRTDSIRLFASFQLHLLSAFILACRRLHRRHRHCRSGRCRGQTGPRSQRYPPSAVMNPADLSIHPSAFYTVRPNRPTRSTTRLTPLISSPGQSSQATMPPHAPLPNRILVAALSFRARYQTHQYRSPACLSGHDQAPRRTPLTVR